MRLRALVLAVTTACGREPRDAPRPAPLRTDTGTATSRPADAAPAPVAADTYPDLATALAAIIPADARVIGFGEFHTRTDRAQVTSTLARFTRDALPALAGRLSDLVVETWVMDPSCVPKAQVASAKIETTVRRPLATRTEIGVLADTARAAGVQPHAMKVGCADYDTLAPANGTADIEKMLVLITRELTRIVREVAQHRDAARVAGAPTIGQGPGAAAGRPWIAVYGGTLHNDRFPAPGVEEWSYAARADEVTGNRFVEIDLIVPELAEADDTTRHEPWFGVLARADHQVHVWKRGERSFVVILPRSPPASP